VVINIGSSLESEVEALDSLPNKELTIHDIFQIFRKRRNVVLGTVLFFTILMAIYCITCTRRYLAKGVIQVQKESADAMGLDSLMSSASAGASDALSGNIELQTTANILQSDTLALNTIQALHLEGTPDFKPHFSPVGWLLGLITPHGVPDPQHASLEDSPRRRTFLVTTFQGNLKVQPVSGTRLIEIDYTSSDPKLAAAVVNTLTRSLSDYTFQTRYDATNQASKWLSEQLEGLRKDSEDLQTKVVNLEQQSGIYTIGGSMDVQGHSLAYSGILDQLQQATLSVTETEQNRILKGAIAHAAEAGNAELLSSLSGNTFAPGTQIANGSMAVIQQLRQQEATENATLHEMEAKFGPAYPRLAEIRENIAGVEHSIQEEVDRVRARAKSDYDVANQTAEAARKHYQDIKRQADALNNKAIEFAIVRQEAEESSGLYEDLLKRLKEAGVLEGLRSSNITVVDPGRVPAKPSKPKVLLYMAAALIGSFVLGSVGALFVDALDNKVNGITDLEESFGESVLGALPVIDRSKSKLGSDQQGLITIVDSKSTYSEALRAIRTSILLSQSDHPPKMILITSSIAGEGKSTCSTNLAAVMAQGGRKTLIVDTDLRKGLLRERLGLPPGPGLSNMLAGQMADAPVHQIPSVPNLYALIGGPTPPNPSDLLASEKMRQLLARWREEYDFVILDSAPVLPVTDSVALNGLTDATILLARSNMTEKAQVRRSYQLLTHGGKHFVGLVLNGLSARDSSYYGYYGYYGYRSNVYGEDKDANS